MRQTIKIIVMLFIIFFEIPAQADALSSLTLSEVEMHKLKKFFPADDSEHLIWNGDPISISLAVGKEKRLIFPVSVNVDLKGALNTDQIRVINDSKSLYLTALKPFLTTRIYVTLQDSGDVILIDLTIDNNTSIASQKIDVKKAITSENNGTTSIINDSSFDVNATDNSSYVDLIRFAWQQIYAPKRIIDNNLHFQRAPMQTQKFVSDLVYGDKVIAHPEISWVSGRRYITAVLLRNKYPHVTKIDVSKDLCGDWLATTLYPRTILQPYGYKDKDSTLLFVISSRPFGEILGVCHGNA
jgi:integrating conjugative element protein (TIGR03749 family)